MAKKEEHICEQCGGDFDNLVTRQGFCQTFFVEWVCKGCFEELEGESFENVNGCIGGVSNGE